MALKHLSLTQKLTLSYAALLLCVLALTAALTLPMQLRDRREDLENDLLDTVMILSGDPAVLAGLREGGFSEEAIRRFDFIAPHSSNEGYLVVANREGIRLYHPDHSLIGKEFTEAEEAKRSSRTGPYVKEIMGTTGRRLRAIQSVLDGDGTPLGFVMMSDSMRVVDKLRRALSLHMALICLAVLGIGLLLACAISAHVRRILLGNDPPTFARMFLQREEILNHLSEGILAFDESRNAVYKNTSGAAFYPAPSLHAGHPLSGDYEKCRDEGTEKTGLMAEINGGSYIVSMIPVVREGLFRIVMMILRDRTEIVRLTEQITGTNHVVDALRANTHEFMNKLHVVSGLLQVGEVDKAVEFIGDTADKIEKDYQTVVRQIQDRSIAALILGKASRAKELNIQFSLRRDSALPAHNPFLNTQEMITVIGNLVENAFDAINGRDGMRAVELSIGCDSNGLSVSVDDTGRGMTEEQIRSLYRGRYTTRGTGHGYGMRLIQEIVRAHSGFLQIDSEPGTGSSISVIIKAQGGKHD